MTTATCWRGAKITVSRIEKQSLEEGDEALAKREGLAGLRGAKRVPSKAKHELIGQYTVAGA